MVKTFLTNYNGGLDNISEDLIFNHESVKVLLTELQILAENLHQPFDVEHFRAVLSQLSDEYEGDSTELGMYILREVSVLKMISGCHLWLGMLSRFHREMSAQDTDGVKWDVEDLSQTHKSRKISQLLRFLISSEMTPTATSSPKKKVTGSRYVAGSYSLIFLFAYSF